MCALRIMWSMVFAFVREAHDIVLLAALFHCVLFTCGLSWNRPSGANGELEQPAVRTRGRAGYFRHFLFPSFNCVRQLGKGCLWILGEAARLLQLRPFFVRCKRVSTRTVGATAACSASHCSCSISGSAEQQVAAIMQKLIPTHFDEELAEKLAQMARLSLLCTAPEAEVQAFPVGNCHVPGTMEQKGEIHLVVTAAPGRVVQKLESLGAWYANGRRMPFKALRSGCNMNKAVTKVLSAQLSFAKFWRTQLGGPECKTELLVPAHVAGCPYPVKLNFFFNAPYPERMNTLLSVCCSQTAELVYFVVHWARQRCVANVARGQLFRYAWGALVLYFSKQRSDSNPACQGVLERFRQFIEFYGSWFELEAAPSISFTSSASGTQSQQSGVFYLEDPMENSNDLAKDTTADGIQRVKEELWRARTILTQPGSATVDSLLEKWIATN